MCYSILGNEHGLLSCNTGWIKSTGRFVLEACSGQRVLGRRQATARAVMSGRATLVKFV